MSAKHTFRWPHAPTHAPSVSGTIMLTAATYQHAMVFRSRSRLDFLQERLITTADAFGVALQAWALFPNHYHWMAHIEKETRLSNFVRTLHASTSKFANELDGTPERKVWFQYWETPITFPESYRTRLNYVHQNAVRHGLVRNASSYPWCSAAWFERVAPRSFVESIYALKYDKLKIRDNSTVKRTDFSKA